MDLTTRLLTMGAAGAGGAEKVYVEDVFSTWLYTGNGSTQTITNGIDLSGEGGLVWLKSRSLTTSHRLSDTARGVNKQLTSNSTAAETTYTTFLTGFNADGFNIGSDSDVNANGNNYASWTFRKAAKFFDVVTYTGNGSNRTISHNLGSVPGCIIVKQTSAAGQNWIIYHRGLTNPEQKYLLFNTAAAGTASTVWNNTAPTSTVFTVGTDIGVNESGQSYVAYLFAHDEQIFGDAGDQSVIKCGSYTGNGSTTGPTISLGWEPQWVLIKQASGTAGEDWYIYDSMRGITTGGNDPFLRADLSAAEVTTANHIDLLATGFQPTTTGTATNQSGTTYIYIAVRRGPMRTPTDATKVFYQLTRSGTSATASISGFGFPPDYFMSRARNNIADQTFQIYDKLRGPLLQLSSISTSGEASYAGSVSSFDQNGVTLGADAYSGGVNYTGGNYIYHSFRRAPGFFEAVAYTGTGVAHTVSHNLGVAPELMIVKSRSNSSTFWRVYAAPLGNVDSLDLNGAGAKYNGAANWNSTSPTSTVFTVGTNSSVNTNGATYIAYLFATCPGVSKVGSYTGSGTTKQIDCGFTAGARFVLIKRTDSTGDWYVWDTARGIVSGNDPYLLLNSTAAEVTSTDYIDPLNSGFEISSTAPAAINANGGSYIFLAIA